MSRGPSAGPATRTDPQSLHAMLRSPKPLPRALEKAGRCRSWKKHPSSAGIMAAEPGPRVLLSPPPRLLCTPAPSPGGPQPVPRLSPHLQRGAAGQLQPPPGLRPSVRAHGDIQRRFLQLQTVEPVRVLCAPPNPVRALPWPWVTPLSPHPQPE